MFNAGQRTAVAGAFRLAGYEGPLRTLPIGSGDERLFVLARQDLDHLRDVRTLEQVVTQLLRLKVAIIEESPRLPELVPFE